MFVRRAHERSKLRLDAYATFDDARKVLWTAFNRAAPSARPTPAERLSRSRALAEALMRHQWLVRDRAGASLAACAILRATMGRRRGGTSRTSDFYSRARAEEMRCEREALYSAHESLNADPESVRASGPGLAMDLMRIRERIRTRSEVGSATSDVDAMERATWALLDENNFETAIAILDLRRRKNPRSVRDGGETPTAFAPASLSMKRLLALLKHLRWVERLRELGYSNLSEDGDNILPLIWKPNSKKNTTSPRILSDDAVRRFAREAKIALQGAIQMDEGDAACAVALAQIEAFEGSYLRTKEILMKCLVANPDDADINAAYAELLTNAVQTRYPHEAKLSSDNFRLEILNACKAVLRVDPASQRALTTVWKMLDRERGDFEEEARFVLESIASFIELCPASRRVWLMLATMLTGLKSIDPAGDADVVESANMFNEQPLPVSAVCRVFDEDRDWWAGTLLKRERKEHAGSSGNGPSAEDIAWVRIHKIVTRVLFPVKSRERYVQASETLRNYERRYNISTSTSLSFKEENDLLSARASERRKLYFGEIPAAEWRKRAREAEKQSAPAPRKKPRSTISKATAETMSRSLRRSARRAVERGEEEKEEKKTRPRAARAKFRVVGSP